MDEVPGSWKRPREVFKRVGPATVAIGRAAWQRGGRRPTAR